MDSGGSRRWFLRTAGLSAGTFGFAGCLRLSQSADTEAAEDSPTESDPGRTTPQETVEDTPRDDTPPDDAETPTDQSENALRIGLLQPLGGNFEQLGRESVRGFYAGLAYHGAEPIPERVHGNHEVTVDGNAFEILVRNTDADPDTGARAAQELVREENVDVLVGAGLPSIALSVREVADQTETPFLVGPARPGPVTNDAQFCDRHVFRTTATWPMQARTAAGYIGGYPGGDPEFESAYLLMPDYAAGDAYRAHFEQVLKANGVAIAGERFAPLGTADFSGVLDKVSAVDPGILVAGPFASSSSITLFRQFLNRSPSFQFHAPVFGKLWASELAETLADYLQRRNLDITVENVRSEANIAPFVTPYHWNHYDNPVNAEFRTFYRRTYDSEPGPITAGLFTAASALVQAAESLQTMESATVTEALRGMSVEATPKGPGGYRFQEHNNQAASPITLGYPTIQEDRPPNASGLVLSGPVAKVPSGLTMVPRSEVNCSL